MARKNVAVLEFGTSRISVIIGDRGINNTFDIRGFGEVNYSGFMDGEFLAPEELTTSVRTVLAQAENNARCKITNLYIGIPAEFSVNAVRSVSNTFPKKHKVTERDIEDLFLSADDLGSSTTHIVVNRSPIYYALDDNRRIIEPKGIVTTKITAMLSFILGERKFITLVTDIIKPLRIAKVDFVSEPLAEALYVLEASERDACAILIDTGYLTTSVSIVMGDGLVSLRSFSLGGGHIVADLAENFKIPFEVAEALKRKIVLSYQPEKGDYYEIVVDNQPYKIDAGLANAVVSSRVVQIAKMIQKCLDDSKFEYPKYIPIQITGGGLCYIKGARDLLQKILNKDVKVVAPPVPQLDKPHASSILGLLDIALKQTRFTTTIFLNIFKK